MIKDFFFQPFASWSPCVQVSQPQFHNCSAAAAQQQHSPVLLLVRPVGLISRQCIIQGLSLPDTAITARKRRNNGDVVVVVLCRGGPPHTRSTMLQRRPPQIRWAWKRNFKLDQNSNRRNFPEQNCTACPYICCRTVSAGFFCRHHGNAFCFFSSSSRSLIYGRVLRRKIELEDDAKKRRRKERCVCLFGWPSDATESRAGFCVKGGFCCVAFGGTLFGRWSEC